MSIRVPRVYTHSTVRKILGHLFRRQLGQSLRNRRPAAGILARPELRRTPGLRVSGAEKQAEPEAKEHSGDPPHGQLQRQQRHRLGDARSERGAERHRDRPHGEPDPPALDLSGRLGVRVRPQELELGDAAQEQREEVVGGGHEGEVPRSVARAVRREREVAGHGEEEGHGERAAHRAAPAPALDRHRLAQPMRLLLWRQWH